VAGKDKRSKEMETAAASLRSSIIVDLAARCSSRLGSCLTASRLAKAIDQRPAAIKEILPRAYLLSHTTCMPALSLLKLKVAFPF
jgi:hypothetical protein